MEQKQRAIIAGCNLKNDREFLNMMEELAALADACDIEVIGEITQKLERVYSLYYFGKGKVQELMTLVQEKGADIVIFNDELTTSQIRHLEIDLKCKVIDRTILILDIFTRRAKTKEAQLQVEIAKLQYMQPRLRSRISGLKAELETLYVQRHNQRKQRKKSGLPMVALVGYTNAGKSTVMNTMINLYSSSIDKRVFEKDMLFATLETYVRNIKLHGNKSFLLSDTVGFIRKLPHKLLKAFQSTLEEINEADLLVHVVDRSNPEYKQHIEVTKEILKGLGADKIPIIYAYNKADLVDAKIIVEEEDIIVISAKNNAGIDKLVEEICKKVFPQQVYCEMLIPMKRGI